MNLKIKTISIENFRCFENYKADLGDKVKIEADNECGKSTLISSILWCLTGKDVMGASDFEIVPQGKYGEVSPSVELTCDLDGKRLLVFKRECRAKLTKDKTFSSYENVCYINGIETGVKKFQEYISREICDEKIFRILLNPYTFIENTPKEQKELVWQAQRKFLMDMVAKSDIEIAEQDTEKWEALLEPLKMHLSIDPYIDYLKQESSKLNKTVTSFADKMEQQQKNIIEISVTKEEAEKKSQDISNKIKSINENIEELKYSNSNDKVKEFQDRVAKLNDMRDKLVNGYNKEVREFYAAKQKLQDKIDLLRTQQADLVKKQGIYSTEVERLQKLIKAPICETCKRPLPADKFAETKKVAEARIAKGTACVESVRKAAESKAKEIQDIAKQISEMQEPVYPVMEQQLKDEIRQVSEEATQTPDDNKEKIKQLQSEKEELELTLSDLRRDLFCIAQNEKCEAEIAELEKQHKDNYAQLSENQVAMDLCKEFVAYKCATFEQSINSLFPTVRFELFKTNKTDKEVKEACNMTFNGHHYEDLSASTKLVANLEILEAFQKHYNVYVPVVIDNRESVNAKIENEAQLIEMYVKEETCPKCNGMSGRRNPDGTWTCIDCGNSWHKTLKIVEK